MQVDITAITYTACVSVRINSFFYSSTENIIQRVSGKITIYKVLIKTHY